MQRTQPFKIGVPLAKPRVRDLCAGMASCCPQKSSAGNPHPTPQFQNELAVLVLRQVLDRQVTKT